jgi:hypothetical protein
MVCVALGTDDDALGHAGDGSHAVPAASPIQKRYTSRASARCSTL